MNVAELITMVRNLSGVSSTNVSDSVVIDYLNIAYHRIENAIVDGVNEDYFWDTFTTDTVADQNEYTLQEGDATTEGIKKIKRVEVKWLSNDTYRKKLRPGTIDDYDDSAAYISDNLSTNSGFYVYREGSLFLYPTPTEAVTNGLYVEAIVDLIDLASGGAESTVFPNHSELRQYHHVIALGAIPYLEMHRNIKDKNDVFASNNLFKEHLQEMIGQLNTKYLEMMEGSLPNSEHYY